MTILTAETDAEFAAALDQALETPRVKRFVTTKRRTRAIPVLSFRHVAGLAVLTLLGVPARAPAQDCGSWPLPVLCQAELVATDADGKTRRLRRESGYRLAPRGGVDLELEGRDQRGRRFPKDRIVLRYEETRCGRMIDIEEIDESRQRGLRISAGSVAGRCRLLVWVPGNLNFEWEIELEVDPGARTSYSRGEARYIVEALYTAILAREADAASLPSAVAEVQQGNLESLVNEMVRSREFSESRSGVSPTDLLDRFYMGLFGRPADTGGVRSYLDLIRSSRYADPLLRMIRSPEFERRLPG